jgi:hypothetical protein
MSRAMTARCSDETVWPLTFLHRLALAVVWRARSEIPCWTHCRSAQTPSPARRQRNSHDRPDGGPPSAWSRRRTRRGPKRGTLAGATHRLQDPAQDRRGRRLPPPPEKRRGSRHHRLGYAEVVAFTYKPSQLLLRADHRRKRPHRGIADRCRRRRAFRRRDRRQRRTVGRG